MKFFNMKIYIGKNLVDQPKLTRKMAREIAVDLQKMTGEPVEIRWPDERQIFLAVNGNVTEYR